MVANIDEQMGLFVSISFVCFCGIISIQKLTTNQSIE